MRKRRRLCNVRLINNVYDNGLENVISDIIFDVEYPAAG